MRLKQIRSADDVASLVEDYGFLPFFKNAIEGFSVEECCPRELWFAPDRDGPWEWKGPVIRACGCAYGKFYRGKACYISRTWFPDFANYRRDGYDYDARQDEGLARERDCALMEVLSRRAPLVSKELKSLCCASEERRKQFDGCLSFLQMQCYVVISDFVYPTDKNGRPYGWGLAQYTTPEEQFGSAFTDAVYRRTPAESRRRIEDHLTKLLPDVTPARIAALIG